MDEVQKAMQEPQPHEASNFTHEALRLYDAGLNVFPIIRASKKPYGPHTILTTTRLHRPSLHGLMQGSNMAVMTGRLSGNLVILDCDDWDVFARIKGIINAAGISAWLRNGVDGGQCWLRCQDGEIANAHVNGVEVLGNRLYSVAPPSIHPSGMIYEWSQREGDGPPLVPIEILSSLGLGLEMLGRRRVRGKKHELPTVANRVLIEQDTTGYRSNSEAEFAACLSLIGVGYSDAEIMRFFSIFPPPHYAKVGDVHFEVSVLDQARMKQQSPERNSSQGLSNIHSSAFIAWAETHPWPGRSGNSDRAVYLALCQRMRMDGGMPFRGSVREVAELAGVNKETVCKSLRRLSQAGLIHLDSHDKTAGTARHFLSEHVLDNSSAQTRTVGTTYTPVGDSVRLLNAHDAWHRDALGKSALACWTELQAAPGLTEAEIGARTGKQPPTVRRALEKLREHGMTYSDDGRWYASDLSVSALDQIAQDMGTQGKAAERGQQHRSERERHATAIIESQKREWIKRQVLLD